MGDINRHLLFMYDACALGYLVTLLSISSWRSRIYPLGIARRAPAKLALSPRRVEAKASKTHQDEEDRFLRKKKKIVTILTTSWEKRMDPRADKGP